MERAKKHQAEKGEGRAGEEKEPTLFSLTNQRRISSQPGPYTRSAQEGELTPPNLGEQGSTSFL